jgi:hypothetical protein
VDSAQLQKLRFFLVPSSPRRGGQRREPGWSSAPRPALKLLI